MDLTLLIVCKMICPAQDGGRELCGTRTLKCFRVAHLKHLSGKYETYAATRLRDEFTYGKPEYVTLQDVNEIVLSEVVKLCLNVSVLSKFARLLLFLNVIYTLTNCDQWNPFKALAERKEYFETNFKHILEIEWPSLLLRHRNESVIDDTLPFKDHCDELSTGACTSATDGGALETRHHDTYGKSCKKLYIMCTGGLKEKRKKVDPVDCVEETRLKCVDLCEEIKHEGLKKDVFDVNFEPEDLNSNNSQRSSLETFERLNASVGKSHPKQGLQKDGTRPSFQDGLKKHNEVRDYEETILNDLLKRIHLRVQPQELQVYMVPGINLPHPSVVCGMLWHMFKREVNRIRTFARYPVSAPKSSLMLASEGFIYIGNGGNLDDHVICYFCCRQKKKWQPLDSIGVVHRELSPECPMITGIDCENEPIGIQSATLSYVTNANTQKSNVNGAMALPNASNLIETDSTLETSQPSNERYRPPPQRTNRIQLATQSIPRPIRQTSVPLVQHTVNRGTQSSNEGNSIALPSNSFYNNLSSIPAFPARHDSTQPLLSQSPSAHASISQTTPNIPVPAQREDAAPSLPLPAPTPAASDGRASSQNTINTPQEVVASGMATTPLEAVTGDSRSGQANTTGNTPTSSGNAKGPTYSELGIITERPKRTEYAPKISRLRTFDNWPRDHHLTPGQLSEAGFYYAGYGDCARCFYCGGGLRNWEDEDDVWVEHARWFPKCAYIRQQMGQVFVDTVQELNKQYTVITYEMVINKTSQPSLYNLESKESSLKTDAAVKTLVAMGYSENDVMFAAKRVKEEFNLVSSDSVLEKLIRDGCQKVNVPAIVAPLTISSPGDTLENIRALKEKNNQLRQQTVCKICMDKEVAVVFLPCGHLISCAECASAMKDCPLCRKPVKGIVRAFIS